MKLFVKLFLIVITFYSFSSFAVKGNYISILKKDSAKIKTFSDFQNNMKKDFLEVRREIAGQSVFVSIKDRENQESLKKTNPSSI